MKEDFDRRIGLGGSDIAAIMGISPWRTPLDVFLEKTSTEKITQKDSKFFNRRKKLEQYVLADYASDTGQDLITDIETFIDDRYSFLYAHFDAIVKNSDKKIIVEAKTTSDYLWSELPVYYKTQVGLYAHLYDADYVDVHTWFNNHECATFRYERDQSFENDLIEKAKQFWYGNILDNVPPPAINIKDIKQLYRRTNNETLVANEIAIKLVEQLKEKMAERKEKDNSIVDLQFSIMSLMRDYEILEDKNGTTLITWKNSSRRNSDGILSETRVFRVA